MQLHSLPALLRLQGRPAQRLDPVHGICACRSPVSTWLCQLASAVSQHMGTCDALPQPANPGHLARVRRSVLAELWHAFLGPKLHSHLHQHRSMLRSVYRCCCSAQLARTLCSSRDSVERRPAARRRMSAATVVRSRRPSKPSIILNTEVSVALSSCAWLTVRRTVSSTHKAPHHMNAAEHCTCDTTAARRRSSSCMRAPQAA